jgi:hypothetical protein
MDWAIWLGIPVVATLLAAIWSWLRSRPAPTLTTAESMQAHSDYLDALAATARGRKRAEPGERRLDPPAG